MCMLAWIGSPFIRGGQRATKMLGAAVACAALSVPFQGSRLPGSGAPFSVCFCCVGDNLLLLSSRYFLVLGELHMKGTTPLSDGAQVGRVVQHLGHRNGSRDLLHAATGRLHAE